MTPYHRGCLKNPYRCPPNDEEKISLPTEEFNKMLDEYYQLREWDENGIPTKEKLADLGLGKF